MQSDLLKTYHGYSNEELLLIIRQPDRFGPEVIGTAKHILARREVTEQEVIRAAARAAMEESDRLRPNSRFSLKTGVYFILLVMALLFLFLFIT